MWNRQKLGVQGNLELLKKFYSETTQCVKMVHSSFWRMKTTWGTPSFAPE